MSVVSYDLQEGIGVITINHPPVNALSQPMREGLMNAVEAAQDDASKVLIIICSGRTFIAGADISEFGKPPMSPSLPELLKTIEDSTKPIIAAIHGTALGGGFETALACNYRCALTSAKVGLPEVKLGLLPGAGGTQRTPRLAGVEAALELMTSGRPVSADKALQMGLIDKVVDGDLLEGAIALANTLIADYAPLKRVRDIAIDKDAIGDDFFDNYRAKLARRARGQLAPQHIVSCVEAAVNLPMDEGLKRERELFLECLKSPQSAAMRHIFFAERESVKIKDLPKETPIREIKSVGIIGGGTMGGGIAMNFVNAGIPVTLLEINDEALERGKAIIAKNYAISVKKGKLSEADAAQRQALITGTTSYADLADADLVIEAVFENLEIKNEVFGKLDAVCKPGAILATNTSYLDVDAIAEATMRPQDVIGLHFFSPANVMKLLEIVRADKTSDEVLATSMALAKKIGKVPVLSRVCYGFIGNRMLRQYARETQLCLIEGSTPEQIDKVMVDWGMAMGPLAVGDLAGIDIGYKARQALTDAEKGDPKTYCIADALAEMGRLGQKTGAGYYQYDPATRAKSSDPLVLEVIEEHARQQGVTRREIGDEEILNRLTFALINEGFKILEEGVAQRPGDIDVVYLYGYGFPAYRGGPMFYADSLGLKQVYDGICEFAKQHGAENWTPSALLEQLVTQGKTLAQWASEQG
ncbi:MAG: 3-hydroxyacyl-CoA dehydrogenase NAD-binding domain-containing protein [Candidatus Thiodiazotropha sp.]